MRLDQLEYLLSLAETGSISRTAERFFLSHQAVSKSLKTLEKELSVTLLERSQKGAALTPAGQRVCQFAQAVLREQKRLENDLACYRPAALPVLQGTLTIYAIPRYITPPFLEFIQKMQILYPHLNIILHNATAERIFNAAPFDQTTLGLFTTCYNIPEELSAILQKRRLSYQVLDHQLLYGCVHNKSPLSHNTLLTTQESDHYPYVSFTYTSYPPVDSNYDPKFVVDSFEQQKSLLKQGNCFGRYTPKEYELFFAKNYALIPLEDQPLMLFAAVYPLDHDPLIDCFLEHYRKANGLSR